VLYPFKQWPRVLLCKRHIRVRLVFRPRTAGWKRPKHIASPWGWKIIVLSHAAFAIYLPTAPGTLSGAQKGYNERYCCAEILDLEANSHRQIVIGRRAAVGLQVAIRKSGDVSILDVQGKATIGRDNDLLNAQLRRAYDGGARKLLVNLAGVTQVDSSGISTIVRTFVTLHNAGGDLKLLGLTGRVKMVLDLMGLLRAIPSFESEAEALASFENRDYLAQG
jgi:anti-sigma B factor antagonist